MFFKFIFFLFLGANTIAVADSISEKTPSYREICQKAETDNSVFRVFRSLPEYGAIVEISPDKRFAQYILSKVSPTILKKISLFRFIDQIGSPITAKHPKLGSFSSTMLRYIVVADQIQKLFSLPPHPNIVEVGAGWGGQCCVLSKLFPISSYVIYDLSEVTGLIRKVLRTLHINNVTCVQLGEQLQKKSYDLFISNYAFSECDRSVQLEYFDQVIKKSDRGYVIYNQISHSANINSLSPKEFMDLLQKNNLSPRLCQEPVITHPDNVLIVWDRTK